jgi:hypothetical protein
MTIGALAADALDKALHRWRRRDSMAGLSAYFQKPLARLLTFPWLLATSEDFRFPETEGGQLSWFLRKMQGYFDEVIRLTTRDERAYEALVGVMHMEKAPTALLSPSILAGLARRRRGSTESVGRSGALRPTVEG